MSKRSAKINLCKKCCFLLTICFVFCIFAGCSEETQKNGLYRNVNASVMDSKTVASNSEYELVWEKDPGAILLKLTSTENTWSDILYDSYLNGSMSDNGNSAITITVADTHSLKWETVRSYSEINENDGYVITKQLENGIRVTYFFPKYEIAIPVDYTLNTNSLNISIQTSQILESAENYKLVSISVAPFLCSASNNEENYLFVPTGSGAIMYTKETPEGIREYTGEVYGEDVARQNPENFNEEENIRLPVFGAKNGDYAICGIIDSGTNLAFIQAQAGNYKTGYSNVYPNFYVRGYDEFKFNSHGTGHTIATRLEDNILAQEISVSFYPLYGEDADYNGMANTYRDYLLDNGSLKKSQINKSPYSVSFIGGTMVDVSILGMPSKELVSLTSFNQANEIVSELGTKYGIKPVVRMSYYGDKGIIPGTILGGKNIPKVYGSTEDLKNLKENCSDTGFFMDIEMLMFSKSGLGISNSKDTARTAIGQKVAHYDVNPIRLPIEEQPIYILRANELENIIDKAFEKIKKYDLGSACFSSMGYMAYSDYASAKYKQKVGAGTLVKTVFDKAHSKGYEVATASANSYAVGIADIIFDVSLENGNYTVFDEKIPFYQMVFHSYKTLYTEPINLQENAASTVAMAASSGMGLGYSVTSGYENDSNDLISYKLYGTLYDGVCDDIKSQVFENGYSELYKEIANSKFVRYEILGNGLTKSVFENNISVYVNNTSKRISTENYNLDAYEFVVTKGDEQ